MGCWDMLRAGCVDDALREMRDAYTRRPTPSCAMELGVGYLWLKRYADAFDHFCDFNERYPKSVSSTYSMAGVSKWCLDRPTEAVAEWREGLDCKYADAAGGVINPLYLVFAASLRRDILSLSEAKCILEKKTQSKRIENWPGPLAFFVLRDLDVESVRKAAAWDSDDVTQFRHWRIRFWEGVKDAMEGDSAGFHNHMNETGTCSWQDYDEQKSLLMQKLWSGELILARFESEIARASDAG